VSDRQLHELDGWKSSPPSYPARACGMEACSEPQHRMQMKPRKAGLTWVSVPSNVTPCIRSWQDGIGDGGGGTLSVLTPGDLSGSARSGRAGSDVGTMSGEKSDRLIRALRPGNAGGAKGATG